MTERARRRPVVELIGLNNTHVVGFARLSSGTWHCVAYDHYGIVAQAILPSIRHAGAFLHEEALATTLLRVKAMA